MILVTVGTHSQGFDRLVRAADELARDLDEPIVIQRGHSAYVPQYAQHTSFVSGVEMDALLGEARVIITHAAAGTIIQALHAGKPLIVVPRSRRLQEVFDEHQMQLAAALQRDDKAVVVIDPTSQTLREALAHCHAPAEASDLPHQELVHDLTQQIQAWANEAIQ